MTATRKRMKKVEPPEDDPRKMVQPGEQLAFLCPSPPQENTINALRGKHWAVVSKRKETYQNLVWPYIYAAMDVPNNGKWGFTRVAVVIKPQTKVDIDNVVYAWKFIQDLLVKKKILKQDSGKYVFRLTVEWGGRTGDIMAVTITELGHE